jgi:hypothetical protein
VATSPVWEAAVVGWLGSHTAEEVAAMAEGGADVLGDLEELYRTRLGFARAIIGRRGLAALAEMGEADFAALIGKMMTRDLDVGLVLQAHREWSLAMLREARDRFLALCKGR